MNSDRRGAVSAGAAVALGLMARGARAQGSWPNRPLTLIVPYTAGGASDYGARLLAPELGRRLGQQVIIENIAGAGGALGVQKLVRAAPDGHTLLYGSLSEAVLVPIVNPAVQYKSQDLLPVALVGKTPVAFVARPDFGANNMDEMLAMARKAPGRLTYGSPGIGTFQHVMAETVKATTGTFITHIPYRGGQNIVTDVLAGQIDLGVTSAPNIAPLLASARIKVLGVSSRERIPALGQAPSFGESAGLKGLDLQTWGIFFLPQSTPASIAERLNRSINEVLEMPAIRSARSKAGSELAQALTPDQTLAFYKAEQARYLPIAGRIKAE